MLRCEAEVMDVIDAMLMEDEELMAELEAQLYDEVEVYTEDMFESEADWDDFNINCIEDAYIFEHKTIFEILNEYKYNYSVKNYVDSFKNDICTITIKAVENDNIHWIRKALYNIAYVSGYSQFYKHDEYTLKDCTIFIKYGEAE